MAARQTIPVIGDSCVYVGRDLLTEIPAELTPANGIKASKFIIISDANVWPLFGPKLFDAFMATGDFEPAECFETTPASKATTPGGFAMGCTCSEIPE